MLKSIVRTLQNRLAGWKHSRERVVRSQALIAALRPRLAAIRAAGQRRPIVAIARTDYLGDIVACEPIIGWVKARHPDAYILWCVREPYREVVENHPQIDEAIVVRCLTEWIDVWNAGLFDEVVELHPAARICTLCNVPLPKPDRQPELTVPEEFKGAILPLSCGHAGIEPFGGQPRIHLPPEVKPAVDRLNLPGRYAVFHCRANRAVRWWLPERWGQLASMIYQTYGLPVVEVGLEPTVPAGEGVIHLCGDLKILESAEVLRRASFFVGVDSGPGHMANALDIPAVLLLAKRTRWENHLPYTGGYADGRTGEIIHLPGSLADLTAETAFAAVQRGLAKAGISPLAGNAADLPV